MKAKKKHDMDQRYKVVITRAVADKLRGGGLGPFALLLGKRNVVSHVRPLACSTSREQEVVDPSSLVKALAEAERADMELVAIFHEHLGPPAPSPIDAKYMKYWRVPWVIRGSGGALEAYLGWGEVVIEVC